MERVWGSESPDRFSNHIDICVIFIGGCLGTADLILKILSDQNSKKHQFSSCTMCIAQVVCL